METEDCWNPGGEGHDLRQQFRSILSSFSASSCPPYTRQDDEEATCRKFRELMQSNWSPFQSLEEVPASALEHEGLSDRFLHEEAPEEAGPWQIVTEEPVEDAEAARFADTVFEQSSGNCAGPVPWWDVVLAAEIGGLTDRKCDETCLEECPAEPGQQFGLSAGSVPWCPADKGGVTDGQCEERISDIFTACDSAEELQISSLWPCPSPKTEESKAEVLLRVEGLGVQTVLHSSGDDEFVACLLEVSSGAEPEVIEDAPGSIVNLHTPSQHQPGAEEAWPPLFCDKRFRKPRSAKTLARYRSVCQRNRVPKVEVGFKLEDELSQRTGHQVNKVVIASTTGSSDVESSCEAKPDVSVSCGLRPGAAIHSRVIPDKELVQALVSLRKFRKSPAERVAFISSLDYTLIGKDLYKCSGASLDELANTRRSPQYFVMYTRYGGSNDKKVTRLRSPPTLRGSKKQPTPQCRRWMQRGKSKIFRPEGPPYGKTYFSYGLRDFEGRRKKLSKKKAGRRQHRHEALSVTNASELEYKDDSDAVCQGLEGFEWEESVSGHRRKRRKLSSRPNDFQMYELYLEEDLVRDKEQRKLKKAPMPYPVICVLKYDNPASV